MELASPSGWMQQTGALKTAAKRFTAIAFTCRQ